MSTMKKLLALALALSMVLSVSAFAGYDYADAAEIDEACEESVQLLYGLDIMKGDGKNFNPNATITRAEMAKMIYVVMNYGKDDLAVNFKGAKMFSDVPAGSWYEGYVNYCATTELVQGNGDGTFNPNGTLSTAAAAKMLLTAIGYSAEARGYVGAGWDKQVLADAAIIGLLDGYNYPTNTAAPRQWVAVMFKNALLNALTYDTITPVIFNGLLTGNTLPTANYKTMGEKYFDLVEFEGVITANEYADLYAEEPLDEGETKIGGKVYNLTTTLDEIGESRWGYAVGSDVMYIEDAGNHTWDNDGAATTVKASKVDMDSLKGAEYFVNFGADVESYYVSDWRIEYVLEGLTYEGSFTSQAEADAVLAAAKAYFAGFGYESDIMKVQVSIADGTKTYTCSVDLAKSIAPGKAITAADMACIKLIFGEADKETTNAFTLGEVYVGTQSLKDVSDEMSYRAFYNTYIEDEADYTDSFDKAVNGEWLKVIDNDDDGVAEYVFLVKTDMVEITDISKKASRYSFSDGESYIKADYIVTEDELAEGDIVLKTWIDGVCYVDLAEVVTETIDKRGIDFKKETLTCGENTYGWSGIDEYTEVSFDEIDELYNGEEYDMYLDRFGYVRVADYPAFNRGFVLLTDGYYETDNRDEQYKAEIFNVETDEFEDVLVLSSSTKYNEEHFINDTTFFGDKDWGRLYTFGAGYATNLAAYTTNDDGEFALYDVEGANVNGYAGYYDVVALSNLVKSNGKAISVATKELTGENGDVHVTTKTQYYLVTKSSSGAIKSIIDWVGYGNAPEGTTLNPVDLVAYAITHDGDQQTYDVADVVVFESRAAVSDELGLVFALDQIRNNPNVNSYYGYDAYWLAYDAEAETYSYNLTAEIDPKWGTVEIDELAELVQYALIDSEGNLIVVDEDFADYNIFAGVAADDADVIDNDYVYVDEASGEEYSFKPANVQNFIVVEDSSTTSVRTRYDVVENEEGYEYGDKLIFVTKDNGTILYVINVDESYDAETYTSWNKNTYGVDALDELYAAIVADATEEGIAAADYLRKAVINGVEGVVVAGSGAEADPFQVVATDCFADVKTATLEVTAVTTAQEIEIITSGVTGEGFAKCDKAWPYAANNTWTFTIDGVYFVASIDVESHETGLKAKAASGVTVDGTQVKIDSTYANETNFVAENAVATVDAAASMKYDAATKTITVTAECGDTAAYTVVFQETAQQ